MTSAGVTMIASYVIYHFIVREDSLTSLVSYDEARSLFELVQPSLALDQSCTFNSGALSPEDWTCDCTEDVLLLSAYPVLAAKARSG